MLFPLLGHCQYEVPDEVLNKICQTISKNKPKDKHKKVEKAFKKHLEPITKNWSSKKQIAAFEYTYYRLQYSCPEFGAILREIYPPKGDWIVTSIKPSANITDSDCNLFRKHAIMKYTEAAGDTVKVALGKDSWQDNFVDGSFSKLKMTWLNNCEFQLKFIESNNESRKSLSKVGDKYNYTLLEKHETFFLLSVTIEGIKEHQIFKLHYSLDKL